MPPIPVPLTELVPSGHRFPATKSRLKNFARTAWPISPAARTSTASPPTDCDHKTSLHPLPDVAEMLERRVEPASTFPQVDDERRKGRGIIISDEGQPTAHGTERKIAEPREPFRIRTTRHQRDRRRDMTGAILADQLLDPRINNPATIRRIHEHAASPDLCQT